MENKVFNQIATKLQSDYDCDEISIYHVREASYELVAGIEIDKLALENYLTFDNPKYIVSESNKPLSSTINLFSRFVYLVKTSNNNSFLFVLSSKNKNAYETSTKDILKDLLHFRSNFL